ncbi:MAG: histidine phosphatase family protein [Marinilabiliales bacterium]|nr:MAG: histidine phosphatase family protein [Marinilabiliales bacterium]
MASTKTLYIGRHAKSSWDFPGRADIDRPLAERGLNNAYEMAGRMKERGDKPARIISSPANRALHTAVIFARELKIPLDYLSVNEDLYMAGEDAILQVVARVDDAIDSLMVFGHNPDFTYLANQFVHSQIYNIPTSGVVRLDFDVKSWEDIHRGKLTGHLFDYPKKK